MKVEIISKENRTFNLENYKEIYETFDWLQSEEYFSWNKTGLVNMAYEAIDRHVNSEKKNKIALYFYDKNRNEKYTFQDMKDFSNKAGNVLKEATGVEKGDRVFIFMPQSPEFYFVLLGAIKLGAIVGPFF